MTVFTANQFDFPYTHLSFPGQHTEELILFVTREARIMLYLRLTITLTGATLLSLLTHLAISQLRDYGLQPRIANGLFLAIAAFTLIALWWVYTTWKKSVFIITTRRLTKFIHTTPWNRYQLSLGLDKIVDTGAYQKGVLQSLFRLGYFVARSAAGNIKNFKIVNISFAEDLHNYVNKLLFTFNKEKDRLDAFRPFIPHLKGEAREQFIRDHAPQYTKQQPPSM